VALYRNSNNGTSNNNNNTCDNISPCSFLETQPQPFAPPPAVYFWTSSQFRPKEGKEVGWRATNQDSKETNPITMGFILFRALLLYLFPRVPFADPSPALARFNPRFWGDGFSAKGIVPGKTTI